MGIWRTSWGDGREGWAWAVAARRLASLVKVDWPAAACWRRRAAARRRMMLLRRAAGDLGAAVADGVGREAADGLVDMIPPGKVVGFYTSTAGILARCSV